MPCSRTTEHRGVPSEDRHPYGNRFCAREATRRKHDQESEFANPEPEVAAPSESRTKRARQDEVGPPQESARLEITWRNWAATTTWLAGLEVCDELNEGNANVDDSDGDVTDEMTGATPLRADACQDHAASPSHVMWTCYRYTRGRVECAHGGVFSVSHTHTTPHRTHTPPHTAHTTPHLAHTTAQDTTQHNTK